MSKPNASAARSNGALKVAAVVALVVGVVKNPEWIDQFRTFVMRTAWDIAYRYGAPADVDLYYHAAVVAQYAIAAAIVLYLLQPLVHFFRSDRGTALSDQLRRLRDRAAQAAAANRPNRGEQANTQRPAASRANQPRAAAPRPVVVSPRDSTELGAIPQLLAIAVLVGMVAYFHARS